MCYLGKSRRDVCRLGSRNPLDGDDDDAVDLAKLCGGCFYCVCWRGNPIGDWIVWGGREAVDGISNWFALSWGWSLCNIEKKAISENKWRYYGWGSKLHDKKKWKVVAFTVRRTRGRWNIIASVIWAVEGGRWVGRKFKFGCRSLL